MELRRSQTGRIPLAKLTGIQFGLLDTREILAWSVFENNRSVEKPRDLSDARLGLPFANSKKCPTCSGEHVRECEGHFAHVILPCPIFHPNHVSKLQKVLSLVCLNCGQRKTKKKRSRKKGLEFEAGVSLSKLRVSAKVGKQPQFPIASLPSPAKCKRKISDVSSQDATDSAVIVLSSDEEDLTSRAKKIRKAGIRVNDEVSEMESPSGKGWNPRKRKSIASSKESSVTVGTVIDLTKFNEAFNPLVCLKSSSVDETIETSGKASARKSRLPTGKAKGSSNGYKRAQNHFSCSEGALLSDQSQCKYCSGGRAKNYPPIDLLVKTNEHSNAKLIEMHIRSNCTVDVAPDFWDFVVGNKSARSLSGVVKKSRKLLPSEALKIFSRIPEAVFDKLGMHSSVARPEALILECLPVPPNCTRIQDETIGSTNLGFELAGDRATVIFTKLLRKIHSIRKSRTKEPAFHAAAVETEELQALFGLYLREKGAPKAAAIKEKPSSFRPSGDSRRWTLDWLKKHVLGKRSGYSARNVLTGDSFSKVEEIGIPYEMAKQLTVPEKVNKYNIKILQHFSNARQGNALYPKCGITRIVRNGLTRQVSDKDSEQLEIGDIVHRHLKDGDFVFVNRPPSLHKHSLLALRVRLQKFSTFTINPAVCSPLHADFDGDCLHVFVPQSVESVAELRELMTVPQQIISSQGGQTIVGLSQDNILAAHLALAKHIFLDRPAMHQLSMWTSGGLPRPAILKSPKGGPLWTSSQVFQLTLPSGLNLTDEDHKMIIQNGELLTYGGKPKWLASKDGFLHLLAKQSPMLALKHLDQAQDIFREWLLMRGFSVDLGDFYCAKSSSLRRQMINKIMRRVSKAKVCAIGMQLISSAQVQFQGVENLGMENFGVALKDVTESTELEDIGVSHFQSLFMEIEKKLQSFMSADNSLLAMVESGSKGSLGKVLQQSGCLGLQLYKGERLLAAPEGTNGDDWEARGLVRSSLLDGLNPDEFFQHSIAVRYGILRQGLEVKQPGELFKRLMLFLRDLHMGYDGTVRSRYGQKIIQFNYGDAKSSRDEDDPPRNWKDSALAGEAVGIVAATAISQPAYQVMLEAPHTIGYKKVRSLDLIQETLFPRSASVRKAADRCGTLRLVVCECDRRYCQERRALQVQNALQPVSLEMITLSTAIEYEDGGYLHETNVPLLKSRFPWVGHIQLNKTAMDQKDLSIEQIVRRLEQRFKVPTKFLKKTCLGLPHFYYRHNCSLMSSNQEFAAPCVHFCVSWPKKLRFKKIYEYEDKTLTILGAVRDIMLPHILESTIKGDEQIESVQILWEDSVWSPKQGNFMNSSSGGELVLKVMVRDTVIKQRSACWNVVKEACLSVMDILDWARSSPYSVQEIKHTLGIEAAYSSILQRLTLALQGTGKFVHKEHLKLVADLVVGSGEANGLTFDGFKDMIRGLNTSAPFTEAAFKAPVKNFMGAAEKGSKDALSGVLASCVWGKRVPLGSGADFEIVWKPSKVEEKNMLHLGPIDAHQQVLELDCLIGSTACTPPLSIGEGDDVMDEEDVPEDACGWMPQGRGRTGTGWDALKTTTSRGDRTSVKSSKDSKWEPSICKEGSGWDALASEPLTDSNGWDTGAEPLTAGNSEGWTGEATNDNLIHEEESVIGKTFKNSDGCQDDGSGWGSVNNNAEANGWDNSDMGLTDANLPQKTKIATRKNTQISQDGDSSGWGAGSTGSNHANNSGWDEADKEAATCPGESVERPRKAGERSNIGRMEKRAHLSQNYRGSHSERPPGEGLRDHSLFITASGANMEPLGVRKRFGLNGSSQGPEGTADKDGKGFLHVHIETDSGWNGVEPIKNGGGDGGWSTPVETSAGAATAQEKDSEGGWRAPCKQLGEREVVGGGWSERPCGQEALDSPLNKQGHFRTFSSQDEPSHRKYTKGRGYGHHGSAEKSNQREFLNRERKSDPRTDSPEWKEICSLAQSTRAILTKFRATGKPAEFSQGDRLAEVDQAFILTAVLPHHPAYTEKIGCGVDFLKVDQNKDSNCFFVVRNDGSSVDFSYHKCLVELAGKKDPSLIELYEYTFLSRSKRQLDSPARFEASSTSRFSRFNQSEAPARVNLTPPKSKPATNAGIPQVSDPGSGFRKPKDKEVPNVVDVSNPYELGGDKSCPAGLQAGLNLSNPIDLDVDHKPSRLGLLTVGRDMNNPISLDGHNTPGSVELSKAGFDALNPIDLDEDDQPSPVGLDALDNKPLTEGKS